MTLHTDGRASPDRARCINTAPTVRAITATVPPDLHDAFEALARKQGLTKGALSRRLIEWAVGYSMKANVEADHG